MKLKDLSGCIDYEVMCYHHQGDIQPIPKSASSLELYKWYENEVLYFTKQIDNIESRLGITASCKKGCNYCCKQLITLYESESKTLVKYLQNLSLATRDSIKKKSSMICESLKKQRITEDGLNIYGQELKLSKDYFACNFDCPLLDQDGTCLVYPVRPVACWSFRNYGDSIFCKDSINPEKSYKYQTFDFQSLQRMHQINPRKSDRMKMLPFILLELL